MTQCERCRYSFIERDERWCRKRLMQQCRHEGPIQRLELGPGLCDVLNPDSNCSVFKPRFRVWFQWPARKVS